MAGEAWEALMDLVPGLSVVGCHVNVSQSNLSVTWIVHRDPELVECTFRADSPPGLLLPDSIRAPNCSVRTVELRKSGWRLPGDISKLIEKNKLYCLEMVVSTAMTLDSTAAFEQRRSDLKEMLSRFLPEIWVCWFDLGLVRSTALQLEGILEREKAAAVHNSQFIRQAQGDATRVAP